MAKPAVELNATGRGNRLGRFLELAIVIVLTICYVLQGAKDGIGTVPLIIILLTLWVPVFCSFMLYSKKPNSELVKHFIGIGYGLFYVAVCIISDQQMVFTYAFPMLLVVTIYGNKKFSITVASGVALVGITHAVVFTVKSLAAIALLEDAALAATEKAFAISGMEIEIAAILFVCIYTVISSNFIIKIQERNRKQIEEANAKTEEMLANVMEVSGTLADEVQVVSDKMVTLANSSDETLNAMNEVTQGTADTADSVQNQLVKTEEIQKQIARVTEATQSIGDSVTDAGDAITEGRDNVANLMKQAQVSETAGNGAVSEVEELKQYTSKMEDIVSMIQNVASQTSLLSLNASIEAARAGEAGRGFAVVASEISNLAAQTETATENISELISNVTHEMDEVAKAITSLVESNKIQNESAQVTAGSFEKIADSAEAIQNNSKTLNAIVRNLDDANKEIIESIQTISAITEEVSAHSTTTCEKTEQNMMIVDEVQNMVLTMSANAEKLKQI